MRTILMQASVAVLVSSRILGAPAAAADEASLESRIEALESQLRNRPVFVDRAGREVGALVDGNAVLFSRAGVPSFLLYVTKDSLVGDISSLVFLSDDCSGPALTRASNVQQDATRASAFTHPSSTTVFLPNLKAGSAQVTVKSSLSIFSDGCIPTSSPDRDVSAFPMMPIFDWRESFQPPFSLVTRGAAGP